MRLVSARRTRSPAAGRSAARAQVRPATSAPLPPTSSVPSARNRVRVQPLILSTCNTEAMNLHLVEIAATVAPGAHAVLLVDQAGWHLSTRLVVPPNITIMALPPKCPELNPVENVWQFLRDNWLSNRVFKSYDDLVDHAVWRGTTSSIRPGVSCPSDCANGRTGSDQWDSV